MESSRRKNKRKRKMIKAMIRIIPAVVAIVLIAIIAVVSLKTGILEKYSYTYEKVDMNEYFGLTNESQIPLMMNNKYTVGNLISENGRYYLSESIVSEYFDDNFYYNEKENQMLYTTGTETKIYEEGKDYLIKNGELYIALDIASEYAAVEIKEYDNPARMEIIYNWDSEINEAEVIKNTQCRVLGGIKSDVLTELVKGSKVTVLSAMDEWSEVKTQDGFVGYVENKVLDNYSSRKAEAVKPAKVLDVPHNLYNEKICMGWHQVMSQEANQTFESAVASTKGMNVISPTWYTVGDNEGNISSIGSAEYVSKAHGMGIRVWALVDNFLENVSMYDVLSNTASRQNLENQLVKATLDIGADGINIDFENLNVECGPHFAQFIRELALMCHQTGLVLSVDNYVPKEYTSFYHREVQGKFADYVVIMGYDEHYSGSETAGSVASFDYVKDGIERTLDDVNCAQVINGIPFYTRIWHEGASLDSEAVGMSEAEEYLMNRKVTVTWDDVTAQNYAEFTDGDGRNCKVWLEDEKSIQAKLNLVKANNLAGVAFWKLGLEKAAIWDIIYSYMNE